MFLLVPIDIIVLCSTAVNVTDCVCSTDNKSLLYFMKAKSRHTGIIPKIGPGPADPT